LQRFYVVDVRHKEGAVFMAIPNMNWRVGRVGVSSGGAARVNDEFRVDVNKMGQLSPSEVRAQSQLAKDMKQQVVLAKHYKKASEDVIKHKVTIEELRTELLSRGLEGAKAVDNLVSRAQLQTGQYMQSLQTTAHATNLGLQAIQEKGAMERETLTTKYAAKAQQARQLQASKLQQIQTNTQQETQDKMQAARDRAAAARQQKQEMEAMKRYIRADDYSPYQANGGGQRRGPFGRILGLVS
jgi:hypothetical protein